MGCLPYVWPCPKSRRPYETMYRNRDSRLSDVERNIPKSDAASNREAQVLSLRWSQAKTSEFRIVWPVRRPFRDRPVQ
jgi:hypothetical protein